MSSVASSECKSISLRHVTLVSGDLSHFLFLLLVIWLVLPFGPLLAQVINVAVALVQPLVLLVDYGLRNHAVVYFTTIKLKSRVLLRPLGPIPQYRAHLRISILYQPVQCLQLLLDHDGRLLHPFEPLVKFFELGVLQLQVFNLPSAHACADDFRHFEIERSVQILQFTNFLSKPGVLLFQVLLLF